MWYALGRDGTLLRMLTIVLILGTALDLLWSAIYTDVESPVCEIPLVNTDSYGIRHAEYTIPITSYNAPESLVHVFYQWAHLVRRLKRVEPRFHHDIARIICDMDPLESPLVPEVRLFRTFSNSRVDQVYRSCV